MSDENAGERVIYPPKEFAPSGTPVAYADFVTSFSNDQEVAKIYFARMDQSANATGNAKVEYVAQLIMPLSRFIATVGFFNEMLEKMTTADGTPAPLVGEIQSVLQNSRGDVGADGEPKL